MLLVGLFFQKRNLFVEGNRVSPNPRPLESFRNLDEQFHFGVHVLVLLDREVTLFRKQNAYPIKREIRKIIDSNVPLKGGNI